MSPITTNGRLDAASPPSPEQVKLICGEIAMLAYRLDREFFFGHEDPGAHHEDEIPERTQIFLDRLREAIGRIGWLAEQAAPGVVREDAREWLLPPIYFSALFSVDQTCDGPVSCGRSGIAVAAAVAAAAAPTGVGMATDLLRHLHSIDDADLDEATRDRHGAECLETAVDIARQDPARWPDFAMAISYVLRISVGGMALERDYDLSSLVKGLDAPQRVAEPAQPRKPPRRPSAAALRKRA